jgi:hypothetical protein
MPRKHRRRQSRAHQSGVMAAEARPKEKRDPEALRFSGDSSAVDIPQGHCRAGLEALAGDGESESARRSGHDRNTVVEVDPVHQNFPYFR